MRTLKAIGDDVEVIRGTSNDGFARGRPIASSRVPAAATSSSQSRLRARAASAGDPVEFLDENPVVAAAAPLLSDEAGDSQARVSTAPAADAGHAGQRGLRHRQALSGQPG